MYSEPHQKEELFFFFFGKASLYDSLSNEEFAHKTQPYICSTVLIKSATPPEFLSGPRKWNHYFSVICYMVSKAGLSSAQVYTSSLYKGMVSISSMVELSDINPRADHSASTRASRSANSCKLQTSLICKRSVKRGG